MKILTYNYYCRPRRIFYDEQVQRAYKLRYTLENHDFDIVMFQELFDNKAYKIIKRDMKKIGYYYKTNRVDRKFDPRLNGGCVVFSKHLIMEQDQLIFKPGSIFMNGTVKGANYCKIRKMNKDKKSKNYHIVNFHLDTFSEEYRMDQMLKIKVWLNNKNIPKDEIIILGGDWNINYYTKEILNINKALGPTFKVNKHTTYKTEQLNNSCYRFNDWAVRRDLDKNEKSELLDFFVIRKGTPDTTISNSKTHVFKDDIYCNKISCSTPFYFNIYNIFTKKFEVNDLSDHYGVSIDIDNY
jgi:phospholipase C